MADALARLRTGGVSVWLDDLSRERLTTGSLAALARDKQVSGGHDQSDDLRPVHHPQRRLRAPDPRPATTPGRPGQALRELTTFDVRWACDVLRPVYEATGRVDGRVSIEVDPRIARPDGPPAGSVHAVLAAEGLGWWRPSNLGEGMRGRRVCVRQQAIGGTP